MNSFQTFRPQTSTDVVVARSSADVVDAVQRARRESRHVAVQVTGHGTGAVDPTAVLVDLSPMRAVTVDPAARTARIEGGARWADVVPLAAAHGLAPLSGSTSGVGVVGYLLGGGLPVLGRELGWAAERVRSFEVVTADGEQLELTDGDRFWALRGGGGSFGVVTAVTIDLVPLDRVFGGSVYFAADDVPDQLRRWRDWAENLPEHVSTSAVVVTVPDVDGPPPPIRGRRIISVRLATTDLNLGPRLADEVRSLGTVLLDGLGELTWDQSDRIHGDPTEPAASVGWQALTGSLPDAALDAAVAAVTPCEGLARRVLEIRRMGGALRRPTGLPLPHEAEWYVGTVSVLSSPDADPADSRARDAELHDALACVSVGRPYGFLGGAGADPESVRAAFAPDVWDRLRAVRRAVDPDELILANAPVPA